MSRQQLRVVYNGPEDGPHIDVDLEKELEEMLSKFGYQRWASGCDMVPPFERDLAFEKIIEEAERIDREHYGPGSNACS